MSLALGKYDYLCVINAFRLRQDGQQFADEIFKYIFFNEKFSILIKISLKFVPKGLIHWQ